MYATDTIAERFRTGDGFAWGAHDEHVLGGCERFFRPGYLNHLASAWIPALDGVEAKLATGARIADVGCGHGASTLLLAEAYPASTVVGFDAHDGSIDAARKRAADAGLADRVRFEVASATTFAGTYDLVCFFDCLHDMGDPAGACAHVRDHLAPGGTLMLIEPFANDDLADNLNPVGAAYYGFSTLLCTPSSLSQDVGTALGAQAGEARLRDIVTGAGFTTLRRVAETPFNIVLEAQGRGRIMKFAQIIEFTTSRIDEFNAQLDAWMAESEGHRIPHRAVLQATGTPRTSTCSRSSSRPYETAMENSARPRTGEFAAFLGEITDGPLGFRSFDVLRVEDLRRGLRELSSHARLWLQRLVKVALEGRPRRDADLGRTRQLRLPAGTPGPSAVWCRC